MHIYAASYFRKDISKILPRISILWQQYALRTTVILSSQYGPEAVESGKVANPYPDSASDVVDRLQPIDRLIVTLFMQNCNAAAGDHNLGRLAEFAVAMQRAFMTDQKYSSVIGLLDMSE